MIYLGGSMVSIKSLQQRSLPLLVSIALPAPIWAQTTNTQTVGPVATLEEITVTGSRIKQAASETVAPVQAIGESDLVDRGYTQVGEALNTLSSNTPQFAEAPGNGNPAGSGQQFPNLFSLGAGRTLSLLNGRRMVTSSSGLGDQVVDTNIIPNGLLERVDVVEAGGAAVYGSDAIAGVVNYVLKQNFDGLKLDAQGGISSRGDYPRANFSGVFGRNFADGRGNIALDVEYHRTHSLDYGSRPITNPGFRLVRNPLNTSSDDGQPARIPIYDPHFWTSNQYGVIYSQNAPVHGAILGQFSPSGDSVVSYDQGTPPVAGYPCSIPFCSGGQGYPYDRLQSLYSGVEARSATLIGHYDLTTHLKISSELFYAGTVGRDPLGSQAPEDDPLTTGTIAFNKTNPFLTADALARLSALSPEFAAGGDLYLGKNYEDLLPTREFDYRANTYRALIAADGDFDIGSHNFNYSASFSHAEVYGATVGYLYTNNYFNAISVARNGNGDIVCAENAVTNVDPACVPINPFGIGNISDAARAYSSARTGSNYVNKQNDGLLTLGGSVLRLPAGSVKYSVTYEHRSESAVATPSPADQNGSFGYSSPPTSGSYHTNEYSAEAVLPIVGDDFSLPGMQALSVNGQYRLVQHSVAGSENVWGTGLRWKVGGGLTLRGSRSRNFRAPNLTQLFAPTSTAPGAGINDPCDPRFISSGAAAATRLANCQALFASHPQWGPLGSFSDPSVTLASAEITTGGNPNLENEVSNTTSVGLVWEPDYVPGNLSLTVDRIQVDIKNGLTELTPTNFASTCFDVAPQPTAVCSTFTRDPATGYIIAATDTTYNAASIKYLGDVFNVHYGFPLAWIVRNANAGHMDLMIDATHNQRLTTNVAEAITDMAGTVTSPSWVVRGDARYTRGPFAFTYEIYYLPPAKLALTDTIETTPFPTVASNIRHSVSALYDFGNLQLRAGVNNLTDKGPSPSTVINYGDIIGREYFLGARFTL